MNQTAERPTLLFQRAPVRVADERTFIIKLLVLAALTTGGVALALSSTLWLAGIGTLLLGAMYTHAVELQHQCLHHSAFTRTNLHRLVGIPLGLPLLVAYSHYRVRHLQHHRYLGTPNDAEFFGFDTRQPLTGRVFLRGLFDYPRLFLMLRDVWRAFRGTWTYDIGQIAPRSRRDIIAEYRLIGVLLAAVAAVAALGSHELVTRLWLLPLLVAVPLHFLVELPEHILCDYDTTDVLRNTRSISGSRFSTWFTNGNNLHIEHHAAMNVPINRLGERHAEVAQLAGHMERSYPDFYRKIAREVRRNAARQR